MNKICVVAKNKKTYFIEKLIEAVGESHVTLFDPWSDLTLPDSPVYLSRTTGIHHSDLDLLILSSLKNKKVYNSIQSLKRFRSKSSQYEWFEENHFPVLPWLKLSGLDPIVAEKFFRLYPQVLVKPDIGQGGWGIEVFIWKEFLVWWRQKRKEADQSYLLCPFVTGAEEYRYLFIQNESPIILKRKSLSGVRANFKQGGEAEVAELSVEKMDLLEGIARKSGAVYGAVDFLIDHNGLLVLELNVVPGTQQLDQVSGINAVQKILGQLLR